jgi:prolyl oligopeptidase
MNRLLRLTTLVLALTFASFATLGEEFSYPETKKTDQVDTYFGVQVADPYRWLEDDHSAETKQWVTEENKVTFGYLEKIPYRQQLKERLEKLYNYPKYGAPFRKGAYYFFSKNDGLQNQSVIYMQKGLDGKPEVLLDPNKFSADGTGQLSGFSVSRDAKYAAYCKRTGGSDWLECHVLDIAAKKDLADTLKWAKFTALVWRGDGFYYSRYDAPSEEGKALTSKNEGHKVYYHRAGTPQSDDELVYEDKANPQRLHNVYTTDDERFILLNASDTAKGKQGNALLYRDMKAGDKAWLPIVTEITDDDYQVIDHSGDKLLVETNHNAPNEQVVLVDPKDPQERSWITILPEKPEPIRSVDSAGGKLFISYLKDVTTRAYVYSYGGKLENELSLPGLGVATIYSGERDDTGVFYTFASMNVPLSIYRYDIARKKSTLFRAPEIADFRSSDYEMKEVFFTSKDGTRVPMFLVHKKGLRLDGNNPTLLYGYGGFNDVMTPNFSSLRLAILEQGFVYAAAAIRGGGEYGENWHQAGTKLRKQNVFDDFIAAAEWLIANKYTSPDRLAIHGVSNGGLLVGAVANQRPDLFKAVIQQAGVMDMLRFHKFTIGAAWIADYGSPDNESEFKALYAYSPVHNIHQGAKYPATLITTADHDDRVVPAHSFKYAAALQAAQGGKAPILIRIDTKSGHGASSTTKALEQTTDLYSFLMQNLGVTPRFLPTTPAKPPS